MLGSIKNHVEEGVTLTMVGFGMGNYRDTLMEKLADAGNGNCFYIDSVKEAKRVFQEKLAGTLEVIAKDVKLQVEFHPDAVASYRLVGYENRDIADKDFRNDKVDAGEIGAGHTVTALYEVQLTGKAEKIATVRIRAKEPSGTTAQEQSFNFGRERVRESIDEASADLRFAAAVAGTADILRGNPQSESFSLAKMEQLAKGSAGDNADRQEFVKLVQKARLLVGDVNVAAR
jgi:Ca-activated chloride channel family protein